MAPAARRLLGLLKVEPRSAQPLTATANPLRASLAPLGLIFRCTFQPPGEYGQRTGAIPVGAGRIFRPALFIGSAIAPSPTGQLVNRSTNSCLPFGLTANPQPPSAREYHSRPYGISLLVYSIERLTIAEESETARVAGVGLPRGRRKAASSHLRLAPHASLAPRQQARVQPA